MSDADQVECEYCGEYFDKRGIGAHQRHCKGDSPDEGAESAPTDQDDTDPEPGVEPEPAPDAETEPSPESLEDEIIARDDGTCRRCGATDPLVVHTVNHRLGDKRANLVTLCASCDGDLDGLHYRTKRTKLGR